MLYKVCAAVLLAAAANAGPRGLKGSGQQSKLKRCVHPCMAMGLSKNGAHGCPALARTRGAA